MSQRLSLSLSLPAHLSPFPFEAALTPQGTSTPSPAPQGRALQPYIPLGLMSCSL